MTVTVAILAGGFGTRLGELTRDIPKPMIEVGGRPYLERVVESFASRELREIVMLTGHRAEVIEEHFGDGAKFGVSIRYSRETEPLGTGGAVREARTLLGARFLLTYGDVLRFHDYDYFITTHDEPCVAVYPRRTHGNIALEGDRVIRYDKDAPELPYIDAGFSLMPHDVIDLLPKSGKCSFEQTVFPKLAAERTLNAEIVGTDFYDIGTPEELATTRAAFEGDPR